MSMVERIEFGNSSARNSSHCMLCNGDVSQKVSRFFAEIDGEFAGWFCGYECYDPWRAAWQVKYDARKAEIHAAEYLG